MAFNIRDLEPTTSDEFTEGKLELLIDAFRDSYEALWEVEKWAYKDTSAGVWVAFQLWTYGRVHSTDPDSQGDVVPYVVDLYDRKLREFRTWEALEDAFVGANRIEIGCIIEGSDASVEPEVIELKDFTDPEQLREAFWQAVEVVDQVACGLWDEVHGDDDEGEEQ